MLEPTSAINRRELTLRSARVAALAALPTLSAAAGLALPHGAAAQGQGGQEQNPVDTLLIPAIGLEETLISVYAQAVRSGRLNRLERRLAEILGEQSRTHVRILRAELSDDAEFPPIPGEIPGLGPGTSAPGYLETALTFENQIYIDYLDAIGGLEPGSLSLTVSGIAASTAQHLALLRQALGREPILGPAENGVTV